MYAGLGVEVYRLSCRWPRASLVARNRLCVFVYTLLHTPEGCVDRGKLVVVVVMVVGLQRNRAEV